MAKRKKKNDKFEKIILFGSMVAMTISWSVHKSISLLVIHSIFSWFYVIYYAISVQVT